MIRGNGRRDWAAESQLFPCTLADLEHACCGNSSADRGCGCCLVVDLTVIFWLVMYALFHEGFALLRSAIGHPGTLARTVHAVYNIFFLSLLIMISISSGILFYGAVYRNPEICLLLTTPVRDVPTGGVQVPGSDTAGVLGIHPAGQPVAGRLRRGERGRPGRTSCCWLPS